MECVATVRILHSTFQITVATQHQACRLLRSAHWFPPLCPSIRANTGHLEGIRLIKYNDGIYSGIPQQRICKGTKMPDDVFAFFSIRCCFLKAQQLPEMIVIDFSLAINLCWAQEGILCYRWKMWSEHAPCGSMYVSMYNSIRHEACLLHASLTVLSVLRWSVDSKNLLGCNDYFARLRTKRRSKKIEILLMIAIMIKSVNQVIVISF